MALIEAHVPALGAELQRAAAWVARNPRDAGLLSMRQQAAQAGVSPNSMARLAQALGYEGYGPFRQVFQDALGHGAPAYRNACAACKAKPPASSMTRCCARTWTMRARPRWPMRPDIARAVQRMRGAAPLFPGHAVLLRHQLSLRLRVQHDRRQWRAGAWTGRHLSRPARRRRAGGPAGLRHPESLRTPDAGSGAGLPPGRRAGAGADRQPAGADPGPRHAGAAVRCRHAVLFPFDGGIAGAGRAAAGWPPPAARPRNSASTPSSGGWTRPAPISAVAGPRRGARKT